MPNSTRTSPPPAPTPASAPAPALSRTDGPLSLGRRTRRWVLLSHVVTSVGWLGVALSLLALAVTGAATGSRPAQNVAYGAMNTLGDWLVGPLALFSLVSGLVLSLGTHWGLARYRWVWTKFWLTLVATVASLTALRGTINENLAAVTAGERPDTMSMLMPPVVSLGLYLFMTGLSVLKPWGPTRRGRLHAEARRTRATARRGRA